MRHRIAILALVAASSVISPGCGDGEPRLSVFPAGGTIRSAGRPAGGAIVVFHPLAPIDAPKGGPEMAAFATEADDQGNYRLSTYEADDGAPAGTYVVTVRPGSAELEGGDGLPLPSAPPRALARFAEARTSPLKATVKAGENHLDFELK